MNLNSEVATEPIVADGLLFQGDWNGDLYAVDPKTGGIAWHINLPAGNYNCSGGHQNHVGIVGSPTVVNNILYVASGPAVYAIDEHGGTRWSLTYADALGSDGIAMLWGSPLVENNHVYEGIASQCDGYQRPLGGGGLIVPNGGLVEIDATTGKQLNVFYTVKGQNNVSQTTNTGGGVWSSTTLSPDGSTIYMAVGNAGKGVASSPLAQNAGYGETIIGLNAATLQVVGYYRPPLTGPTSSYADVDFGTTPAVFPCNGQTYVSANGKDGNVYTVNASAPSNGAFPKVWQKQIANPADDPARGGSIASSAYAHGILYVAGGPTPGGSPGSVQAFDACTGQQKWSGSSVNGLIFAPLSYANRLVVDGSGNTLEVRDASSGNLLYHVQLSGSSVQESGAIIVNGMLFVTSTSGTLYAFAPHS